MIAYRATLDVPRELAQFTARLLQAERRRRGTPRGSRALTCFWQAALGLRWFRGPHMSCSTRHQDRQVMAVCLPPTARAACPSERLTQPREQVPGLTSHGAG